MYNKLLTIIIITLLTCGTNVLAEEPKINSQIAVTYSNYNYEEPNLMEQQGNIYGLDASLGLQIPEEVPIFVNFELALSDSEVDYTSQNTGSIDGQQNNKQEIRTIFGVKQEIFSPYVGLGIRRLENDSEGMISTTGHYGYNRVSKYFYLPVGLIIDLISNDRININAKLEYDHLIIGRQTSDLTYLGGDKIKNNQNDGSGYRISLQLSIPVDEFVNIFVEPFYEYWDIGESDVYLGYYEPQNTTKELGIKFGVRF